MRWPLLLALLLSRPPGISGLAGTHSFVPAEAYLLRRPDGLDVVISEQIGCLGETDVSARGCAGLIFMHLPALFGQADGGILELPNKDALFVARGSEFFQQHCELRTAEVGESGVISIESIESNGPKLLTWSVTLRSGGASEGRIPVTWRDAGSATWMDSLRRQRGPQWVVAP